jgi:hypothetical protein
MLEARIRKNLSYTIRQLAWDCVRGGIRRVGSDESLVGQKEFLQDFLLLAHTLLDHFAIWIAHAL